MSRILSDLRPIEVSLVDRPAVRRKFLILKRDGGAPMDEETVRELLDIMTIPTEGETELIAKAGVSGRAATAVKGALRLLAAYKDELPDDLMCDLAGIAGYGNEPEDAAKARRARDKAGPHRREARYGYPMPREAGDGSHGGVSKAAAWGKVSKAMEAAPATMLARDLGMALIQKAADAEQARNASLTPEQAMTRALKNDRAAQAAYDLYRSALPGETLGEWDHRHADEAAALER